MKSKSRRSSALKLPAMWLTASIPFKMDARTKFSAVIKQAGTVVNFVRQDQGDLVDWVRRRFRALGKDIDSKLALDLIFLCGDLMTNLIGEIEKIGAYAKGVHITRQDIDAVATPQLDAVVFRMTDSYILSSSVITIAFCRSSYASPYR